VTFSGNHLPSDEGKLLDDHQLRGQVPMIRRVLERGAEREAYARLREILNARFVAWVDEVLETDGDTE
jgi:hypothetical protein